MNWYPIRATLISLTSLPRIFLEALVERPDVAREGVDLGLRELVLEGVHGLSGNAVRDDLHDVRDPRAVDPGAAYEIHLGDRSVAVRRVAGEAFLLIELLGRILGRPGPGGRDEDHERPEGPSRPCRLSRAIQRMALPRPRGKGTFCPF